MATPQQIQQALKLAKESGNEQAAAELRQMLIASYSSEADPTEGMSGMEKFRAGIGSGLVDIGRKAANLALPEGMTPDWASDEAIKEQANLDDPLLSTGAGLAGNIVGGIAGTAPVGFGAAGLATKALPQALKASTLAARAGRGLAQGAAQGASEGLLMASPDDRLGGAGLGAAVGGGLGAVLPGAGHVLKRSLDKLGRPAIEQTDEAVELMRRMREAGVPEDRAFIPLSQSAKPGLGKQIYEGFVSNIPGNKVRQQYDEAVDQFREMVVQKAVPKGTPPDAIIEAGAGDSMDQVFRSLKGVWDEAFTPVNEAEVMIPKDFFNDNIIKAVKKATGGEWVPPPPGLTTGKSLTEAAEAFQQLANQAEPGVIGNKTREFFLSQKKRAEELLESQLPKDLAEEWAGNKAAWKTYQDLLAGTKGAMGTGEFTPKALAQATARRAGAPGAGGEMQELGVLGQKALQNFPSRAGVFQTLAATGAAGGAAGYLAGENPVIAGILGIVAPVLGAKFMSKPSVQRALTQGWQFAKNRGMSLSKYKEELERAGLTANQIAVGLSGVKE